MPAERLSMRKLREFLRLHFVNKLPARAIARSVKISPSTAQVYVSRIRIAGLSWPLPPELDSDEALTRVMFADGCVVKSKRPEPNWAQLHLELKKKHVTRQLLWEEYKTGRPDGYQYSAFCERFERWESRLQLSMRQEHRAGEKLFVDFSGDGIPIVEAETGEVRIAKLFVAVLGASSLTYVEAVLVEDLPTWVQCHVNALTFVGGSTAIWVPDNLKAGVTKPDRYEPDLNPTYANLAEHYGVAVIPARVRKPKDKAKVEVGVLLAQRWIIAALRKRTFFSLEEVREAIKPLLEKLNLRRMRRVKKSRRQLFEELDRPALKPLPTHPWEFTEWKHVKAGINYHVEFKEHFYSVPYLLRQKRLEVRATTSTVEVLFDGSRVASHERDDSPNQYTTVKEHMPRAHRDFAEWDPPRLIAWASKVGPGTAALVEGIMSRRVHPQHGFQSCQGVLALRKTYEDARIEAACARAVKANAFSYQSVKAILKNGLDRQTLVEVPDTPLPTHGNIRGSDYYH
jgi:transposase